MLTRLGPVEVEVPRERDGTFEPVIVRKRQRRLDWVRRIYDALNARPRLVLVDRMWPRG